MKKYALKAILFDLDGTLVNSLKDLALSANYVRTYFGLPPLEEEVLVTFIGHGMKNLVFQALEGNQELLAKGLEIFKDHYEQHCLDHTHPYPGVREGLSFFYQKLPMAVITNKPVSFSQKILEHLELSPFFEILVGGDSCEAKKPSPLPIRYALEKMELKDSSEIMLVGDSEADIQGAKNANILSCAVTYGLRKQGELEKFQPNLFIHSFLDLKSHIRF